MLTRLFPEKLSIKVNACDLIRIKYLIERNIAGNIFDHETWMGENKSRTEEITWEN
jgi:hypothetical protein